jgi:predicted GIY-YIG superfamily endonuclease
MHVYEIKFPDNTRYIGATKSSVANRVSNHRSKWKQGTYQCRKIYQKMSEFKGVFYWKVIGTYKTEKAMYKAEEVHIALTDSLLRLNNSTGGKSSSKGKSVSEQTIQRRLDTFFSNQSEFEIYCSKSMDLLYRGSSQSEASKIIGCTTANISYALKREKSGVKSKRKSTSKYIFKISQGVGYSNLI